MRTSSAQTKELTSTSSVGAGLDLLPKLRGADPRRVAAVGFSYCAAISATLAGVDHRLLGAVIQSGRAHLSVPLGDFCHSGTYRRAYHRCGCQSGSVPSPSW